MSVNCLFVINTIILKCLINFFSFVTLRVGTDRFLLLFELRKVVYSNIQLLQLQTFHRRFRPLTLHRTILLPISLLGFCPHKIIILNLFKKFSGEKTSSSFILKSHFGGEAKDIVRRKRGGCGNGRLTSRRFFSKNERLLKSSLQLLISKLFRFHFKFLDFEELLNLSRNGFYQIVLQLLSAKNRMLSLFVFVIFKVNDVKENTLRTLKGHIALCHKLFAIIILCVFSNFDNYDGNWEVCSTEHFVKGIFEVIDHTGHEEGKDVVVLNFHDVFNRIISCFRP